MKINSLLILFLLITIPITSKANDIDAFLDNLSGKDVPPDEKNLIKNQPYDRFVDYAKLQVLNKSTGETTVLDVKIGEKVTFENIEIEALKCWKSYPEEQIENKLLLKIYEKKRKSLIRENIFYGWFFSSSPSVSSLEHYLYDVKLLNCYNLETQD